MLRRANAIRRAGRFTTSPSSPYPRNRTQIPVIDPVTPTSAYDVDYRAGRFIQTDSGLLTPYLDGPIQSDHASLSPEYSGWLVKSQPRASPSVAMLIIGGLE
ncbi:hypothetical protein EIP91_004804 [Steccherinum ochraceum]|uniref:Uncharacterized protein n=1 Tax=Steccherinum ochraceum TaxID=92696 RepID=A0A4R0REA2_9APHY|nr:hypothetical protein EIP91_004804 [Steccherinum ochraceum]